MSEHQSLIYVITFVFIGIAVFIGLKMFDDYRISSNKEAIVNSMNTIAEDMVHYTHRPSAMGGGEISNYKIPRALVTHEEGGFTMFMESNRMIIVGTSSKGFGQVKAIMNANGKLSDFSYAGQFE